MIKVLFKLIIIFIQLLIAIILSILLIPMGITFSLCDFHSEYSMFLSKVPMLSGEIVRYIYYKLTLKSVGKYVRFKYGSAVLYRSTEIGDYVLIGYNTLVGECSIGNDVLIGSNVNITSGTKQHGYDEKDIPFRKQKGYRTKIKIDSNVWIGNNCVVANDIGSSVVIGIGSLVIKPVIDSGIYYGSPAILRKEI